MHFHTWIYQPDPTIFGRMIRFCYKCNKCQKQSTGLLWGVNWTTVDSSDWFKTLDQGLPYPDTAWVYSPTGEMKDAVKGSKVWR